jgi:hypothetical protein
MMSDRVSKFAPIAEKRMVLLMAKVPVRQRAIYLAWLKLAGSDMSEDLRAYLEVTVKRIQRMVKDLPAKEQEAFWRSVETEQRTALKGKIKVLRRAA